MNEWHIIGTWFSGIALGSVIGSLVAIDYYRRRGTKRTLEKIQREVKQAWNLEPGDLRFPEQFGRQVYELLKR